jgi:tRNA/tmRNA/rRNA uracil-C5-methylase (TrmA/RlmC/RlmD family)
MSDASITLDVLKPAAGGRMVARSEKGVVLVSRAIPGERVRARVERVGKGVTFAEAVEVLDASPDRRPTHDDWRCGGQLLAHIEYPRQLQLKGEILSDAFARIAKLPLGFTPAVVGSPERGYRMRARFHAAGGRLGFFREGTHEVCDPACTGQLLDDAVRWVEAAPRLLGRDLMAALMEVELTESVDGRQRACHLSLRAGAQPASYAPLADGLTGLTAQAGDRGRAEVLTGSPMIAELLDDLAPGAGPLRLERQPRAFFQSNRFLLRPLVERVMAAVPRGPVIDLYAGVGLFGLALASAGVGPVTLVEGDGVSGDDLEANARPWDRHAQVVRRDVESFLASPSIRSVKDATVVVDPPRTGLSRDAVAGLCQVAPPAVVYVSCDVATLARDARVLVDAGYTLETLEGLDLFPNTGHVESLAVFRAAS